MQSFSYKLPPGWRPVCIPAAVTDRGFAGEVFSFTRPHFFHVLTEEGVAAMFLKAVAADVEQARAFVSKNSAVDLESLRSILDDDLGSNDDDLGNNDDGLGSNDDGLGSNNNRRPSMIGLKRAARSGFGVKTRSILLQSCILHLHMIEEPDRYGPWKIFGVEKENR